MNRFDGLQRLAALMPVVICCAFAIWQAKAHFDTVFEPLPAIQHTSVNIYKHAETSVNRPELSLDILASRPLFTETRRPYTAKPEPEIVVVETPREEYKETEKKKVQPPAPVHTLVGVVVRNAKSIAILQNNSTGETIRIQNGMSVGGWRLDNISAKGLKMSAGRKSTDITVGSKMPKPL